MFPSKVNKSESFHRKKRDSVCVTRSLMVFTDMISFLSGTWQTSSAWGAAGPVRLGLSQSKLFWLGGWWMQQEVSGLQDTRQMQAFIISKLNSSWSTGMGDGLQTVNGTCIHFAIASKQPAWFHRYVVPSHHLVHLTKCTQPQGKLRNA